MPLISEAGTGNLETIQITQCTSTWMLWLRLWEAGETCLTFISPTTCETDSQIPAEIWLGLESGVRETLWTFRVSSAEYELWLSGCIGEGGKETKGILLRQRHIGFTEVWGQGKKQDIWVMSMSGRRLLGGHWAEAIYWRRKERIRKHYRIQIPVK